jgi:hypothetical protein
MVGQILPNNNEMCYGKFSPTFHQLNTPLAIAAAALLFEPYVYQFVSVGDEHSILI